MRRGVAVVMPLMALVDFGACSRTAPPGQPDHVAVTVTREGMAVPGATVIFHDSDGAPLWAAFTDPSGRVDRLTEDDGMVTVIDPEDGRFLLTITHVPVPMALEVPLTLRVAEQPSTNATLRIEAPPSQVPQFTDGYFVETACGVVSSLDLPKRP